MNKLHLLDEHFKATGLCGITTIQGGKPVSLSFVIDETIISKNPKCICKNCLKKYYEIKSNERG